MKILTQALIVLTICLSANAHSSDNTVVITDKMITDILYDKFYSSVGKEDVIRNGDQEVIQRSVSSNASNCIRDYQAEDQYQTTCFIN